MPCFFGNLIHSCFFLSKSEQETTAKLAEAEARIVGLNEELTAAYKDKAARADEILNLSKILKEVRRK